MIAGYMLKTSRSLFLLQAAATAAAVGTATVQSFADVTASARRPKGSAHARRSR
jgi:hypothetical protein